MNDQTETYREQLARIEDVLVRSEAIHGCLFTAQAPPGVLPDDDTGEGTTTRTVAASNPQTGINPVDVLASDLVSLSLATGRPPASLAHDAVARAREWREAME